MDTTADIDKPLATIDRSHRLHLAWTTTLAVRAVGLTIQAGLAPLAFRLLKPEGFAVYAASTAFANILSVGNVGLSGAVVTPLATAAARKNSRSEQAKVFSSAIWLSSVVAALAALVVVPPLLLLPTQTILGRASAGTSSFYARITILIAVVSVLLGFPLSLCDGARTAYQEVHRSNIFSFLATGLVLISFGAIIATGAPLPWYAAAMLLSPVAARIINLRDLWQERPFLRPSWHNFDPRFASRLLADGVTYLGATFTAFLLYQWPIYLITRWLPLEESASLSLVFQVMLLSIAFMASLVQPMWGSVADSRARSDGRWLGSAITVARQVVGAYGLAALLGFGLLGSPVLRFCFGDRFHSGGAPFPLVGLYVALAVWEYLHYTLLLGCGQLRKASIIVAGRGLAFAGCAPLLLRWFGCTGLLSGLVVSIAVSTAWCYPLMFSRCMAQEQVPEG